MIELYDNPVSTSAQKVRLVLAEKGLEFKAHMMDLQAGDQFGSDFLKVNPSAQIPALLHDGHVIIESNVICEYLDEMFPEPPLKPATPYERSVMRSWTEQTISWCITMINNINVAIVFAPMLTAQKSPEDLAAQINAVPNPIQRERQRMLYDLGAKAPQVEFAITRFHALMGEIDETIKNGGPWLAGDRFSLADTSIFPYLNRLHDMQWDAMWDGKDHYLDWYDRIRARPSFKMAISDVVPQPAIDFAVKCSNDARPVLDKIFSKL